MTLDETSAIQVLLQSLANAMLISGRLPRRHYIRALHDGRRDGRELTIYYQLVHLCVIAQVLELRLTAQPDRLIRTS